MVTSEMAMQFRKWDEEVAKWLGSRYPIWFPLFSFSSRNEHRRVACYECCSSLEAKPERILFYMEISSPGTRYHSRMIPFEQCPELPDEKGGSV